MSGKGTMALMAGIGIIGLGAVAYAAPKLKPPPKPGSGVNLSVNVSSIVVNPSSYQPATIQVYVSGATPNGVVNLLDQNGNVVSTFTTLPSGVSLQNIQVASYHPAVGSGSLTAKDMTTGIESAPFAITYVPGQTILSSSDISSSWTPLNDGSGLGNITVNVSGLFANGLYSVSGPPLPGHAAQNWTTAYADSSGKISVILSNEPSSGTIDISQGNVGMPGSSRIYEFGYSF